MRQRVHRAEPFLKSDCAHHRRHHHGAARFEILRLIHHAGQVPPGHPRSLQRHGVANRMVALGQIGLHVVRERVHAGSRRDVRRQAQRQLRIAQRQAGDQVRAEDHRFAIRLFDRDDGRARHLAARARSGGDGDIRRQIGADARSPVEQVVVFRQWRIVRDFQPDRLGCVERRSTAQPDNSVALGLAIPRHAVQHISLGRVRLDIRIDNSSGNQLRYALEQRCPDQPRVGYQQRTQNAAPRQFFRQFLDCAGAEQNRRGKTECG